MIAKLQLFNDASAKCAELLIRFPGNQALTSIARQIDYLIDIESGVTNDRSRMKDIIIGVLTAREIEPLDEGVAELLYKVAGEAARM